MYEWVLRGSEEALGPKHTSILQTINDLGKLAEAEKLYARTLRGYEDTLDQLRGDLSVKQGGIIQA
ncbi:hypothetical protein MMC18_001240 [Xylographa bjoerkii]|nr:hypothetical protein [Xylographa bjoerkii]